MGADLTWLAGRGAHPLGLGARAEAANRRPTRPYDGRQPERCAGRAARLLDARPRSPARPQVEVAHAYAADPAQVVQPASVLAVGSPRSARPPPRSLRRQPYRCPNARRAGARRAGRRQRGRSASWSPADRWSRWRSSDARRRLAEGEHRRRTDRRSRAPSTRPPLSTGSSYVPTAPCRYSPSVHRHCCGTTACGSSAIWPASN